jgi:hypothetical protein
MIWKRIYGKTDSILLGIVSDENERWNVLAPLGKMNSRQFTIALSRKWNPGGLLDFAHSSALIYETNLEKQLFLFIYPCR